MLYMQFGKLLNSSASTVKRCVRIVKSQIASFQTVGGKLTDEQVDELARERSQAASSALETVLLQSQIGGGSKAIHRHTVINKKLLVRKRLELLFDKDSPFLEIGATAGFCMEYGDLPSAGSVAGIGKIHGCYCIVMANDATVKGGTLFPISVAKQIRVQHLSLINQLPCIYLVDSGGAFLPLQADIFPDRDHGGRTFYNEAVLTSRGIPQIAIVCGSCTAGGAYCPMMCEDVIIVKKSGTIFLGGPPLVKAATGEIASEQELGGAEMHCSVSGCTDHYAENEEEAFELCRDSVLALNILPPVDFRKYKEPLHPTKELNLISGKTTLQKEDIYQIVARIFDGSMFKEFKRKFGSNLVTGFSFLCGKIVGIVANCGNLTWQDAQKGTHFILMCQSRNIPIVFLQNSGEKHKENCSLNGMLFKERGKMISSHSTAAIPKITVNVGGCFGDDNFTMCGMPYEANFVFSWPLAHASFDWVPVEKRISVEDCIINSDSYPKLFKNASSAFSRASKMLLDGIIQPEDTRQVLACCLDIITSQTSHNLQFSRTAQGILRM